MTRWYLPYTTARLALRTSPGATPGARDWGWLWLIITVGAVLRLYRLDGHSLWLDEGWQYFFAQPQSLHHLFAQALDPTLAPHPPLSYLVHYCFLTLRDSDWMLRLPSVFFGLGSVLLSGILARKLISQPAALYTALVCAISPFHIWYSQEGRMYAQLLFLSLLSSLFLIKATEQAKRHWWVWYTLVTTAGLYTHTFMALSMMAHCAWILLCRRRAFGAYSLSTVATGMLCLPLAHFLFQSYASRHGSELPIGKIGFTWWNMPYTFFIYAAGFSLGPSVAELHENRSLGFLLQFFPIIFCVVVLYAVLLVMGLLTWPKQGRRSSLLFCLANLGIPLVAVVGFSFFPRGIRLSFNVRYTIMAFPYFCLLIGTAFAWLMHKHIRIGTALLLAVVGLAAVSLVHYHTNPRYAKSDVKAAVAFWREHANSLPLLSNERVTVARYLHAAEKMSHFPILEMTQPVSTITHFFSTHDTALAYVLLERDWYQLRENAIRHAFTVDQEQAYPGVKIFRIARP